MRSTAIPDIQSTDRSPRKPRPGDGTSDFAEVLGGASPATIEDRKGVDFGTFGQGRRSPDRSDDAKDKPVAGENIRPRQAEQTNEKKELSHPAENKSAAGTEQKSEEDGLRQPDSGTGQAVESAKSVDGSEKGVPPGASTEATVSAQNSDPDIVATGESSAIDEKGLIKLIQRLQQSNEELPADVKEPSPEINQTIKARIISHEPNMSLLAERGVVFQTGLAEQIIRLLTNKFDELKAATLSDGNGEKSTVLPVGAGVNEMGSKAVGPSLGQLLDGTMNRSQAAPMADQSGSIDRIVNVIRSNLGQRFNQLTIQLDPPELGRLRIDIRLAGTQLRVNITTETASAQTVISERFALLREALEKQGITINRFEVQMRDPSHTQTPLQYPFGGHSQPSDFGRRDGRPKPGKANPTFGEFIFDPGSAQSATSLNVSTVESSKVNLVA
jgi:flagellar hook-length control protein FliK